MSDLYVDVKCESCAQKEMLAAAEQMAPVDTTTVQVSV